MELQSLMQGVLSSLSRCKLFDSFSEAGLQRAAEVCRSREFNEGEIIYTGGSSTTSLAILVSGSVRITSSLSSGKESILAIMGASNWIGGVIFDETADRLYTSIAHEPVRLLEFSGEAFHKLLNDYPEGYPGIQSQITRRLRMAFSTIDDHMLRSIPERVGRRLLFLQINYHNSDLSEEPLSIKLTQEQLANMVGMTRQGMQKAIKTFESEGLLQLDYRMLTLTNPMKLKMYLDNMEN